MVVLDRQLLDCPQARPLSPTNGFWRDCQFELGPAFKKRFQRALALDTGELVTQTEMNSRAEREMAIGAPLQIDGLRIRVGFRIHIGCGQHDHDLVTGLQPNPTELNLFSDKTRLGELHGRDEAQKFLNRQIN
jgi:hypothetical protein